MRYDLFPTSLWHIKNEISQPLVDELYRGAYDFKEKYESAKLSNQGGYQSPPFSWDSFHPDGIKVVNDIIRKAIEVDVNDLHYKMSTWWVNFQKQNDFNPMHGHTGLYSFVVWLKIPTEYVEQNTNFNTNSPEKSWFWRFFGMLL